MNMSDLLIVVALASGTYALIVALTRQRAFLERAVNPHRGTWLLAAAGTLWVGLSLLRWEAGSWNFAQWSPLLQQLVTDAPTPPRVKVASMALLLGATFLILVSWCQFFLPRDPSTYHRPEDRRRAFRYYVSSLRGGLDFALLASGDGEVLEEAADVRQIKLRVGYLPKVPGEAGQPPRARTMDDQVESWRRTARQVHERMAELDRVIEHANQGHIRRLVFDTEFGGFFFKYLRLPDPRGKVDTSLYLFATSLDQTAMENQTAERHFHLLLKALQNIERGIRVS